MKKTAIALAVSAVAFSSAQAQNIVVDGYIDRAWESTNSTNNTSDRNIINSSAGTSTIGFSGSEDLGGGLRAGFRINTDFNDLSGSNLDNPAAFSLSNIQAGGFANSQLWLQIGSKDLGDLRLGTINNETLTAVTAVAQPGFSTGVGSIYSSSFSVHAGYGTGQAGYAGNVIQNNFSDTQTAYAGQRAIRQRDSVYYYSPDINGLKIAAGFVPNNDKGSGTGNDNVGVTEFSVRYTKGALDAMHAQIKYDVGSVAPANTLASGAVVLTANSSVTHTSTGLAFVPVAPLRLNVGYFTSKSNGNATVFDTTATSVGGSYNLTAAASLMAVVATVNDRSSATNMDRKLTGVGVNYMLSKRTRAYLRHDSIVTDEGREAVEGNKLTRTAVGISHTF